MDGSMRIQDRRLMAGVLCACAALGALAGTAAGQAAAPAAKSSVQIHERRNDTSYSLHIEDGRMWAEVNGERVPDERLRKRDGKVELLGEDGEVLTTFSYSEGGAAGGGSRERKIYSGAAPARGFQIADDAGRATAWAVEAEPPKVMVGVTMVDAPEHLRRHLNLGENEAVMLGRVIEGLPAAEAGLKSGDVIIAIAGEKPATAEALRAALQEKEPGGTLELTVVQDGEEKSVKLKLRAYDPEKLNVLTPMAPMGQADEEVHRLLRDRMRALEEERDALAERGRTQSGRNADNKRALADVERRRQQLEEQMRELREQFEGMRLRPGQPGDAPMVFEMPSGELRGFVAPPAARAGVEKRVKELDERLSGLDARLDALDKKLGRIEETLDRLAEQKNDR